MKKWKPSDPFWIQVVVTQVVWSVLVWGLSETVAIGWAVVLASILSGLLIALFVSAGAREERLKIAKDDAERRINERVTYEQLADFVGTLRLPETQRVVLVVQSAIEANPESWVQIGMGVYIHLLILTVGQDGQIRVPYDRERREYPINLAHEKGRVIVFMGMTRADAEPVATRMQLPRQFFGNFGNGFYIEA